MRDQSGRRRLGEKLRRLDIFNSTRSCEEYVKEKVLSLETLIKDLSQARGTPEMFAKRMAIFAPSNSRYRGQARRKRKS
jgi:hypothetical protein